MNVVLNRTVVTVNNDSPIQDYVHPDDQTQLTFVLTYVGKKRLKWLITRLLFYSVVVTKQKKKKEKEDAIKIEDITPTDTDITEEKEPSNPAPHQPPPPSPPPPPPVPGMCSKLNQVSMERFLSRDHQISKFITTEQRFYVRKRFNSNNTGLGHQHGRRFTVWEHQYGRRDVMWKRFVVPFVLKVTAERKHWWRFFYMISLDLKQDSHKCWLEGDWNLTQNKKRVVGVCKYTQANPVKLLLRCFISAVFANLNTGISQNSVVLFCFLFREIPLTMKQRKA